VLNRFRDSKLIPTRRAALATISLLAAFALAGCNAPQSGAVQPAPPAFRIGTINVNTSPLLGQSGQITATWAQSALPGALAQALAANMSPGDASAGTLNVTIQSIMLGPVGPGGQAMDSIRGVATLTGVGAAAQRTKIRADTSYEPMAVDQALWEQAMQGRVTTLSQAFADTVARRLR
jgi:hypothetical protein